jgi:hypothetical protein
MNEFIVYFYAVLNPVFRNRGYDYMNFRCWIGLWTASILLIMVVTDASYLVKYITRFTGKFPFEKKNIEL